MSKIISIGTAVPEYKHEQKKIFEFISRVYALNEVEKRKLRFMFHHSGIESRHSILPDFGLPVNEWQFFPPTENLEPFPSMEKRMKCFRKHAAPLSLKAIADCLKDHPDQRVTHLITVSCTGMSAPGLDLELMELLNLPVNTWRTSVNFMGCYAAIHALKLADAICRADASANVLMVCVEFCTLHFQREYSLDNISSGILFADGAAAVLITGNKELEGMNIEHFYSSVSLKGKQEMVWELSSTGFLLNLSGYIPDLIEENFNSFVSEVLKGTALKKEDITHWCLHPGGKKVLQAVHNSLQFTNGQLQNSYDVLSEYGNMSSPTILFVLNKIRQNFKRDQNNKIFGAAFGPGLTMESFILST
ncbi:MAG TPA: type III polyketide synthase [Chitinophagaceae bacterium]|nr:type III polyketide synthase [Chitinophagaceae bacterium]